MKLRCGKCMATVMKYRECTLDDFAGLVPLFCQLWPDRRLDVAKLKAVFVEGVNSETERYLCAEDAGRMVGFCNLSVRGSLWQQANLGYIAEFVVDESFRRRGVGTGLLNRICEIARDLGCRRIELDSAFHRTEAYEFYEKNGFEKNAMHFSKRLSE